MRKSTLVVLVLGSLSLLGSCGKATSSVTSPATVTVTSSSQPIAITSKKMKAYVLSPALQSELTVNFLNGEESIPFLEIEEGLKVLRYYTQLCGDSLASYTLAYASNKAVVTRENGSTCTFDFQKRTVTFSNHGQFFAHGFSKSSLDIVTASGFGADGKAANLKRFNDGAFIRSGGAYTLDLGAYELPVLFQDGKGYLALSTFSDIFLTTYNFSLITNGIDLFGVGTTIGPLKDLYYAAPVQARSEALANFSYHELLFSLDKSYGLKGAHGIKDFESFLTDNGLKEGLLSTDPVVADKALKTLTENYFADFHSGFGSPSFYAGKDADVSITHSDAYLAVGARMGEFSQARAEIMGATVPSYEVVNTDTAFITFDSFTFDGTNYYEKPPKADTIDTIGVIAYAHSQIVSNPAIKNVVLDLSCNGGGTIDSAAYTLGAFLDKAIVSATNVATGDAASIRYASDTNFDHEFDSSDTFGSLKLYCLISPSSFSCGNLVPSVFKSSGRVTLVGQTTGGGSQVVQPSAMADGSIYQISGPTQMSTFHNGGFYSVEAGAAPDIALSSVEDFYHRSALATYLKTLL